MVRLPIAASRVGASVSLTAAERHYLEVVLRLAPGAALQVFDGEGGRYPATLQAEGALALGSRLEATAEKAAPVVLAQALAKGEKMELVIQKATELGAHAIAPFSCERAVVKLEGDREANRRERWGRIAAAAASQCERDDVPQIHPVATLDEVIARANESGARAVLLYERERERRLSEVVLEWPGPLVLIAGPEGGFSDKEVERARAAGAAVVGLGSRILRTETVALAVLSIVQHLRGELG